jgi:mannose-6-phosphate isomerase-like protein (cupin superfamily)
MLAPLRMPGSSLMSRLKVYGTAAIDGQIGGTPHVHLLCTEMYLVLGGSGAVEIIDKNGFSRVDLGQHDALLFSEGTIHRLINPNGDLEILVIMQNSGLPERGDNVVCFAENYLANDTVYAQAMRVSTLEEAYQRRNRGVEGFLELKGAFARSQAEGQAALERFYTFAAERTKNRHDEWQRIVQAGAMSAAQESQEHLDALAKQNFDYLSQSNFHLIKAKETQALGFCGHLDRYFDPASLMPEGIRNS